MTLAESIRSFALAPGEFDKYRMPGVESTVLFAFGENIGFNDMFLRNFDGEYVYNVEMDAKMRTFALLVAEAIVS